MIDTAQLHEARARFRHWPKIALHRHLPGAIRFEQWQRVVQDRAVPLPAADSAQLRAMMTVGARAPLTEYLKCFDVIDLAFADARAIEQLTYDVIAGAAAENIIYLELRYSPTRMAVKAGISTAAALQATIAGRDRAARDFDLEVSLIAGLSREMGVQRCAQEAQVITSFAAKGIAAIDLLGNEIDFPAAWFAPIFQPIASQAQMGITIHAGESSGARCVRDAVELLGATRIGHGVRSEEDPTVLDLLRRRQTTLEMCPTSNVQTQATPDYTTHPLPRYLRAGIYVTINTDNPAVSQVDLAHEYAVATTIMGLTRQELRQTLHHAVDAAFTSPHTKERLHRRLNAEIVL